MNEYFEIKKIDISKEKDIVLICEKIAESHNVRNGGTLIFSNLIPDCDYLYVANIENKVIGYIALKIYDIFKDTIYVEQIAIASEYQRHKIASSLLQYVIDEFKDKYSIINAHVRVSNTASNNLFQKIGFKQRICDIDKMLKIGFSIDDIDKENYYEYDL